MVVLKGEGPEGDASLSPDPLFVITAPLRMVKTAVLQAPPAQVFPCVTHATQMTQFVPGMVGMMVAEDGRWRYCDFGDDMILAEEILIWRPPQAIGYRITANNPFGLHDHFGLMQCQPGTNASTQFSWQQYYNHDDPEAMFDRMNTMMTGLMQNLIHKFGGEILEHQDWFNSQGLS